MSIKHVFRGCTALAALFAAACAYPVNGPENAHVVTDKFPITVEPHMETLRVSLDAASGAMDADGGADLRRFVRDYLENGSGVIGVSAPRRLGGAPNAMAARLVAMGVPRGRIMLGADDAANPADQVKLTYIRYQAHTPPCGDWSVNLGSTAANMTSPNFGCATQHNLAAMVTDPRDLVSPKPLDPDDAQRRLTVLDKYRKGETTVAAKTSEQTSVVSSVAGGGGGGK